MDNSTSVLKTNRDLYPDVTAFGGLAKALQSAFHEIGSFLTVSELDKSINFVVYARVEKGTRFSQIYIAAEERLFLLDFWARGVVLAHASTSDLRATVRAIEKWVALSCNTAELATAFDFVSIEQKAAGYERGEEVEERWRSYIESIHFPELVLFVKIAAKRPQLRQLFPFTSLNNFCFSRCTGYPFTGDTPYVQPLKNNEYQVVAPSGKVLGRGNAEAAADLVVVNLPSGCGPALPGTAEDLVRATD